MSKGELAWRVMNLWHRGLLRPAPDSSDDQVREVWLLIARIEEMYPELRAQSD